MQNSQITHGIIEINVANTITIPKGRFEDLSGLNIVTGYKPSMIRLMYIAIGQVIAIETRRYWYSTTGNFIYVDDLANLAAGGVVESTVVDPHDRGFYIKLDDERVSSATFIVWEAFGCDPDNQGLGEWCFQLGDDIPAADLFQARFEVQFEAAAVEGAVVCVDGYGCKTTGAAGIVAFDLPAGNYTYIVTHDDYADATGSVVIVDADIIEIVSLVLPGPA